MPAKMVFVRTVNAASVAEALETHAAATGAAWGELLAPFLAAGEELPDMALVQRLTARLLAARGESLQEADAARLEDRDDLIPPRLRRRAATERVLEQMRRLRLACQGHYGRELASQIVAATEAVSDRPWQLLAQAEATLARLQDPAFTPPADALPGFEFDPVRFAQVLAPAVAELRAALSAVLGRSRKSESTLVAKQKAMSLFDREYSGAVKMFQGLFTLVDQAGLAERLRPPRPRRSSSDLEQTVEERRDVDTVASPQELPPAAEPAVVEEDVLHPYPRLYAFNPPLERALAPLPTSGSEGLACARPPDLALARAVGRVRHVDPTDVGERLLYPSPGPPRLAGAFAPS